METTEEKRADALKRVQASREKKRKRLAEIETMLRAKYRNRTGEEPKYFFAI